MFNSCRHCNQHNPDPPTPNYIVVVQAVVLGHGPGQDPVGDQGSAHGRRPEGVPGGRRHHHHQDVQEQQDQWLCEQQQPGLSRGWRGWPEGWLRAGGQGLATPRQTDKRPNSQRRSGSCDTTPRGYLSARKHPVGGEGEGPLSPDSSDRSGDRFFVLLDPNVDKHIGMYRYIIFGSGLARSQRIYLLFPEYIYLRCCLCCVHPILSTYVCCCDDRAKP